MDRLEQRQAVIDQIRRDDPERSAAYILVDGIVQDDNGSRPVDWLVSWHGSGDETSPVDFFVFRESFRGNELQTWQADLINNSKHQAMLGSPDSSLKQTWVCSFHEPITADVWRTLKARFVGP